ncbi:hypothetical protein ACKGJO_12045 [Gracilimonas sp. Q87]|uniref:hypothetical protein n=1 Tax=Gracilimonas sp. Q87 TaxID=3384766 RepID=UPI003983FFB9
MMSKTPIFFLFIACLFPAITIAQDRQAGADNTLLPEINPQDIEIRSEFKARFPGLRRQPILGFNPTPRVFQIDPNRIPFIETREEAVANIAVTQLGRPEPPTRSVLRDPQRVNGYLRSALGSYLSPDINGYGYYALSENSAVNGNVNLRGSTGHLDGPESSFRYLDANASFVHKLKNGIRLSFDVGALNDFNDLYNIDDPNIQSQIGETASKDYYGFNGQLRLQKVKNTLNGWDLTLGGNLFNTTLDAGSTALSGETDEKVSHLSFSYYWPGQKIYETIRVTGNLESATYSADTFDPETWVNAEAALTYERLFNFSTRVKAKGGVSYITDAFDSKVMLSPEVEIIHYLNERLSVTGTAFGRPKLRTLQEHHQYNRFLSADNLLRHSYDIGAGAEANFQLFGGNRVFGGVTYTRTQNYAFYQRTLLAPNDTPGFYSLTYGDANIFEIYAGANQQLVPHKFWANVKAYARSPKLSAGGDIPYEEKIGLEGALSFKPVKELTLNTWVEYLGKRQSPETGTELKAFALLNAGAEYQVNDKIGVFAKLLNITGQEYEIWKGYQERPFQIFGGITLKL